MIETRRVRVSQTGGFPWVFLDATEHRDTETGEIRLVLDPLPEIPEPSALPRESDSSPPTS